MSKHKDSFKKSISIAITGSGGAGVMTAGNLLLEVAAQAGWYGLMMRSSGPQIRGGEAAALLRFSHAPVECLDDRFDALIGIDWQNIHRFADEIPLDAASVMIGDPAPDRLVTRPCPISPPAPVTRTTGLRIELQNCRILPYRMCFVSFVFFVSAQKIDG